MHHFRVITFLPYLGVLASLLLGGCRSTKSLVVSQPSIVTPSVVVTARNEAYPAKCSPDEVAKFVTHFFDAYNANDSGELVKFFDTSLHISGVDGSFSDTLQDLANGQQTKHFVTASRNELFVYIAKRHTQGEQLRLRHIEVFGTGWHGGVDIGYQFLRQARDLPPGEGRTDRIGIGKGTIQCPDKKIEVWSMTTVPRIEEGTIRVP